MLESNGLLAPAGHVPFEAIATGWDQVLAAAHTLGHRYVCVAWIDEKFCKDIEPWKRVAETLNHAGEACRRSKLTLVYSNHSYHFIPLAGQGPSHVLLASTDPS